MIPRAMVSSWPVGVFMEHILLNLGLIHYFVVAGMMAMLVSACGGPLKPRGKMRPKLPHVQGIEGSDSSPHRQRPQETGPSIIKDAALTANIVLVKEDEKPKVTYLDIKPIFAEHCVACHKDFPAGKGLNLKAYPFESYFLGEDQVAIVKESVKRMRADIAPMPTSGKLPESITDVVEQWLNDGLLPEPKPDPTGLPSEVKKVVFYWRTETPSSKGSSEGVPQKSSEKLQEELRLEVAVLDHKVTSYNVTLPQFTVGHRYHIRVVLEDHEGNVLAERSDVSWLFTEEGQLGVNIPLAI